MRNLIILRNITGKLFCFGLFGFFGYLIALLLFPLVNLLFRNDLSCQRLKMTIIKKTFTVFIFFARIFAMYKIDTTRLKKLSALKSYVVVANHPSLIDIIFLIKALPNPDCIVKNELFYNFWFKGIVRSLFVSSSNDFDVLIERCKQSLENGNNIIIFPEGSRTKSGEKMSLPLKRGAAHIALRTGFNILPLHIKTQNYVGLAKYDSIFKVHKEGYALFTIFSKKEIAVADFAQQCIPIGARKITKMIENSIFYEEEE